MRGLQLVIRFTGILLGIVVSSIVFAQERIVKVTMATSMGNIEIGLYADKAPTTVSNFLQLIDGNHLDGGTFYRVVNYANDNGSPKITPGMGA
jgi:hypothetical protein